MKIRKYPDPVLLEKAAPVTSAKEADKIVTQLFHAASLIRWGKVAGLAAPQIGISRQVFIAGRSVYINPQITRKSDKMVDYEEGCYSLERNKVDYKVSRPEWIELSYQDIDLKHHSARFEGREAQVLGHELDHLVGKLCVDYTASEEVK